MLLNSNYSHDSLTDAFIHQRFSVLVSPRILKGKVGSFHGVEL